MKSLEDLGFILESDEAHQQRVNPADIDGRAFFERSHEALDELSKVVLAGIVPRLEEYRGRWHPSGFMAYPLGLHPELGSLRLHVWPNAPRQILHNRSGTHDHAWYLASRVLAGVYSDVRFNFRVVGRDYSSEAPPDGLLRVFRATKTPGEPDALKTDGTIAKTDLRSVLSVPAGQTHTIEPGEFHWPTITADQLATTLVLDSPSLGYSPQILINRSPEPIINPRAAVEPEEATIAKQQILEQQEL